MARSLTCCTASLFLACTTALSCMAVGLPLAHPRTFCMCNGPLTASQLLATYPMPLLVGCCTSGLYLSPCQPRGRRRKFAVAKSLDVACPHVAQALPKPCFASSPRLSTQRPFGVSHKQAGHRHCLWVNRHRILCRSLGHDRFASVLTQPKPQSCAALEQPQARVSAGMQDSRQIAISPRVVQVGASPQAVRIA